MRLAVSIIAVCAILLFLSCGLFVRFFSYTERHGGGMPYVTEDGRTALNDHGRVKYVSRETYREALLLWRAALASCSIAVASTIVILLLFHRRRLRRLAGPDREG